jgi:hypothetical protein
MDHECGSAHFIEIRLVRSLVFRCKYLASRGLYQRTRGESLDKQESDLLSCTINWGGSYDLVPVLSKSGRVERTTGCRYDYGIIVDGQSWS